VTQRPSERSDQVLLALSFLQTSLRRLCKGSISSQKQSYCLYVGQGFVVIDVQQGPIASSAHLKIRISLCPDEKMLPAQMSPIIHVSVPDLARQIERHRTSNSKHTHILMNFYGTDLRGSLYDYVAVSRPRWAGRRMPPSTYSAAVAAQVPGMQTPAGQATGPP
jgi:hypothetical protein